MDGTLLNVGDEAPAFTARTHTGSTVSLADFAGSRSVLLMFYPKDDTPGCTRQMCAARDEATRYEEAGIVRFGVNPGSQDSHRSFADKYTLDFPILVDEDSVIARSYGVLKENGGVARATYVIDPTGRIAYAASGAHGVEEILETLRG